MKCEILTQIYIMIVSSAWTKPADIPTTIWMEEEGGNKKEEEEEEDEAQSLVRL